MSPRTLTLDDQLYSYILDHSLRESEVLHQLRQENNQHPQGRMQISPEQGQFLGILIHLLGAKRTLEIGVFTGYSSLSVALALPEEGRILACDVSSEFTSTAQRYWQEAGVAHKIDLRIGPALETLDQLLQAGEAGQFDFAFIDADKSNYLNYYERCLELLRPGGLIAIDNVLWGGQVADPENQDKRTVAIRSVTDHVHKDPRVNPSLVPIGDGLLLALKV